MSSLSFSKTYSGTCDYLYSVPPLLVLSCTNGDLNVAAGTVYDYDSFCICYAEKEEYPQLNGETVGKVTGLS